MELKCAEYCFSLELQILDKLMLYPNLRLSHIHYLDHFRRRIHSQFLMSVELILGVYLSRVRKFFESINIFKIYVRFLILIKDFLSL
jgi:hypothetical protein